MNLGHDSLEINGRQYLPPTDPIVVVCIDGSEPAYHHRAIEAGRMPFLADMITTGSAYTAECAMPSFTNPNNLSIATGTPPSRHGICGNYFYDAESDAEVMMNDPRFLRVPTIFAELERAGHRCAVITAKDKLRRLLGKDLRDAIRFSAECADSTTLENNGVADARKLVGKPLPEVYSAELSEFVLAAGTRVLEQDRPDVMYLSLTDYVQHKHAPASPAADDFYAMMDDYFARLDAAGATLVITADHGMNAKSTSTGEPNVVYVQERLDEWTGVGQCRVVLPITDPYTAHHGALGSFATVHLPPTSSADVLAGQLARVPGIERVLGRDAACAEFELPGDRIGDLVLVAERQTAIGTTPERHDLSGLDGPLRSHGGLSEQNVPFLLNRRVSTIPAHHRLRNYDAYWIALNHAARREPLPRDGSTSTR